MTSRALIVAAVVGQKGGGADGDVLIWRPADGGTRWEQPEVLNDVPGAAREGMHALASNTTGLVVAAWLTPLDIARGSADQGPTAAGDLVPWLRDQGAKSAKELRSRQGTVIS